MSIEGPTLGPCVSWIDGDAVAACGPCVNLGSNEAELLESVAVEASMALYELSGGVFNGICERTVRPCRVASNCWDMLSSTSWRWTYDSIGGFWGWWGEERGVLCGCQPLSIVKLAGYPVQEILEVLIDGVPLDEVDADGNRNWRLDGYDSLVRMDSPGPPLVKRRWPGCQNEALDDDQPGTFSVTYTWGQAPPPLGQRAAAQLACQLALSCGGGECVLPDGVTRVTREGITIERELLLGFLDPDKPTGLANVDLFMAAYVEKGMAGRRPPAVFSPDVQQYARPYTRRGS